MISGSLDDLLTRKDVPNFLLILLATLDILLEAEERRLGVPSSFLSPLAYSVLM